MTGKNYIKLFRERRFWVLTWILNPLVTLFSIYFYCKSILIYKVNIISNNNNNNNMIYSLLISNAWDERDVARFETLFHYFDILVYIA
jgi:hypothetical protein